EQVDAYLFVPPGDPTDVLEQELDAAHRMGLTSVETVDRAPIEPFHTGIALRFPGQGMFHPLAYLDGLVRAFERGGGRIHEAHALELKDDERVTIQTRRGPVIHARDAVVATNSPIHLTTRIHTKQAPYRSYAIGARVPRGSIARALYY